jgi:hypothetical protein
MTSHFGWLGSLRVLPHWRALALAIGALLLAVADWLPPNQYVDPDLLEFTLTMALGWWAIAIAMSDRLSREELRTWRNRITLLACSLVLSALAAEAVTRFVFRDITTTANSGGYFSRRWARSPTIQANHSGFRDRDFAIVKPQGPYRIAVVGDSFTYGNGIPEADRYTNRLQAWLPATFEVLNFGVPGDNTPEEYISIASRILPTRPDYILLQWFVNDVEGADASSRPRYLALLPPTLGGHWFARHSALYDIASMAWLKWQVRFHLATSYPDYLIARTADPSSVDARREHELVHDIASLARREHIGLGIVLFPDAGYDLGADYPFTFLHQRVLEDCRAEHISCLDLQPTFASIKDRSALWVNRFDHHPSARANEIAALEILTLFQPQWIK